MPFLLRVPCKFGPANPHPAPHMRTHLGHPMFPAPPATTTTNVFITYTLQCHLLHPIVIGLRFQLNNECSFHRGRIPIFSKTSRIQVRDPPTRVNNCGHTLHISSFHPPTPMPHPHLRTHPQQLHFLRYSSVIYT